MEKSGKLDICQENIRKMSGNLLSYFCMFPCNVGPTYGNHSNFQENFSKHGVAALNLTMDYDENEIMNNNLKYLTNTLEVSVFS